MFVPIPGRFAVQTRWEHAAWITMSAFCGWFFIQHAGAIVGATTADGTITHLIGGVIGALANAIRGLVSLLTNIK